MNKNTCTAFENILNTIHNEGITTKSTLIANQQLYAQFWMATENFVHFALASKNGKTTKKGKMLSGNSVKIDILENYGFTTKEDVVMECVARIIEYTDYILCKPSVSYMRNYAYSIVNSFVNTLFKEFSSNDFKIISLNSIIQGTNISKEDAYTYEEIIRDETNNPERLFFEHITIKELEKELKAKQAKAQEEKRKDILHEATLLSKYPAEILARFACNYLSMKPRELTTMIMDKGCEDAYAEIIFTIGKQNHILKELRNIIAENIITENSVKADTHNKKMIADQISRLLYRANKRLNK